MKFAKGSETSYAAAVSIEGRTGSLRSEILTAFRVMGPMTCDDIEVLLDLRHQTASARVRELVEYDQIAPTGERKATRSGRGANIYAVTRHGEAIAEAIKQRTG